MIQNNNINKNIDYMMKSNNRKLFKNKELVNNNKNS